MTDSLPLKRGMLHYAYSRKLPVQVIIAANKEAVLSEKHSTARFGQTIWAGYSGMCLLGPESGGRQVWPSVPCTPVHLGGGCGASTHDRLAL